MRFALKMKENRITLQTSLHHFLFLTLFYFVIAMIFANIILCNFLSDSAKCDICKLKIITIRGRFYHGFLVPQVEKVSHSH